MRVTQPLFRLDPGWLFIAAGLVVLVCAIILPAQRRLIQVRHARAAMAARESTSLARLEAHARFRDLLEEGEPALVRRMAVSQLNMIRAGYRPLIESSSADAPVTDWIDATVDPKTVPKPMIRETTLSRLVCGPRRHWVIAGSVFCIFIGLMIGPARETPLGLHARKRDGGGKRDGARATRRTARTSRDRDQVADARDDDRASVRDWSFAQDDIDPADVAKADDRDAAGIQSPDDVNDKPPAGAWEADAVDPETCDDDLEWDDEDDGNEHAFDDGHDPNAAGEDREAYARRDDPDDDEREDHVITGEMNDEQSEDLIDDVDAAPAGVVSVSAPQDDEEMDAVCSPVRGRISIAPPKTDEVEEDAVDITDDEPAVEPVASTGPSAIEVSERGEASREADTPWWERQDD